MSIFTALAVYFVIWWLVLFAVLPWGVRSQEEAGDIAPGTDPGAPALPMLRRKLIWTTIVATIVYAVFDVVYRFRLVSLDDLSTLFGLLK